MNIYIQTISNLSHKNKYLKWYINIVENAQRRAQTKKEAKLKIIYAIGHHIVPESFFKDRKRKGIPGKIEGNSNDKQNISYLTPKEHLTVHRCLSKCLMNKIYIAKNSNAICRMLQSKDGIYIITTREYEYLMKQFIENNPGKWKSSIEKSKQTKLEKYGEEYYSNPEQYKQTCLVRYGVKHYSKTEKYKETFANTMVERYGVGHALQNKESFEKFKQTCLRNNGVEYPMQSEQVKEKSVKKRLELYGVEYNMQSTILLQKSKDTCLKNWGVDNPGKRMVVCKHCKEYKNINHQHMCKLNPTRKIRDISGKHNPNFKG